MLLSVTPREFATILAALRLLAGARSHRQQRRYDIASDCGEFEPLDNDEIDTLCEQLNTRA